MNWNSLPSRNSVLYFCLVLSGWTSLTYELLWIKQLTLIIGGTLYAISAVLCAFMLGLALGSWGISRVLHRFANPPDRLFLLYGLLEGCIGLYALAFPFLLKSLEGGYPLLLTLSSGSGSVLHFLEFIAVTLLMLPATFMMGATLPVVGSWTIGDRRDDIFSRLSFLYALNTFGAVAGCLFTQFWGTRVFGILGTLYLTVFLNVVILVLCYVYRAARETERAGPEQRDKVSAATNDREHLPDPWLGRFLLFIFGFSGMVALSSEILWTRVLVFPLGSSLYSFAIILATFLFGIALGSLIIEKLPGGSRWVTRFLAVEIGIGVLGLLLVPALDHLTVWTLQLDELFYDLDNSPARTLTLRSLFAAAFLVLPALGFGMAFPLANHIHFALFGSVARTLGSSYAVNTLGAIAGTVLTPFVFVPQMGIRLSLFVLYGLLILLGAAALAWHRGAGIKRFAGYGAAVMATLGVVYGFSPPVVSIQSPGQHNLARVEIDTPPEHLKLVDYKEGDFTTLSVLEDTRTGGRTLYVDGFSTATASDSIGGSAYMQAMGFVPMILHPNPKRALVMCFGTGNTLGTVSRFPGVTVDGVEIDRNVLSMAHWFSRWNHDILKQPNTTLHVQDARQFIRWTDQTYDVITLEPMSPVQAGVNNLYSREFYRESRHHLNPGGIMMQWLPLHLVPPDDAWSILKTFQAEFPHVTVWNSFLTRIVLLVGSTEPVRLNKPRFEAALSHPDLKPLAEQIGLYSFIDLMDFYITDARFLEDRLESATIITDDNRILEHSSAVLLPPLKRETDETFLNLLLSRVGRFPKFEGVVAEDEPYYRRHFLQRTGQRLSIFSQRYRGPGHEAFAQKEWLKGMKAVGVFLRDNPGKPVRLTEGGWHAIKRELP